MQILFYFFDFVGIICCLTFFFAICPLRRQNKHLSVTFVRHCYLGSYYQWWIDEIFFWLIDDNLLSQDITYECYGSFGWVQLVVFNSTIISQNLIETTCDYNLKWYYVITFIIGVYIIYLRFTKCDLKRNFSIIIQKKFY